VLEKSTRPSFTLKETLRFKKAQRINCWPLFADNADTPIRFCYADTFLLPGVDAG
jgi:hypothetical protein